MDEDTPEIIETKKVLDFLACQAIAIKAPLIEYMQIMRAVTDFKVLLMFGGRLVPLYLVPGHMGSSPTALVPRETILPEMYRTMAKAIDLEQKLYTAKDSLPSQLLANTNLQIEYNKRLYGLLKTRNRTDGMSIKGYST